MQGPQPTALSHDSTAAEEAFEVEGHYVTVVHHEWTKKHAFV